MTLEERVARGVELLDATSPQWAEEINLDQLNMENCTHCILGQLYHDFGKAPKEALYKTSDKALPGYYYGFNGALGEMTELGKAWRKAILERRKHHE